MTDEIRKARTIAKRVAVHLWKIRSGMGLTQQEFADKYLVEKSAISNFERGRSVPFYIAILYAVSNPSGFMEEVINAWEEYLKEVT